MSLQKITSPNNTKYTKSVSTTRNHNKALTATNREISAKYLTANENLPTTSISRQWLLNHPSLSKVLSTSEIIKAHIININLNNSLKFNVKIKPILEIKSPQHQKILAHFIKYACNKNYAIDLQDIRYLQENLKNFLDAELHLLRDELVSLYKDRVPGKIQKPEDNYKISQGLAHDILIEFANFIDNGLIAESANGEPVGFFYNPNEKSVSMIIYNTYKQEKTNIKTIMLESDKDFEKLYNLKPIKI